MGLLFQPRICKLLGLCVSLLSMEKFLLFNQVLKILLILQDPFEGNYSVTSQDCLILRSTFLFFKLVACFTLKGIIYCIFQSQLTFSIILYLFQLYSTVVRQSYTL